MKAILRVIKSNNNRIRTSEVVGDLLYIPQVGTNLIMFAEPLEPAENKTRMVSTSLVTELFLLKQNLYSVSTRNTLYELEVMGNVASD